MKSAALTPRSEIACFLTILLVFVLFICAAPFIGLSRLFWRLRPALKWVYRRFFLLFLYPTTGLH